jgi:HEPN domain-containing protein
MMEAVFHCCGTVEVERERLNSRAIGLQKTGAPIDSEEPCREAIKSSGGVVEFVQVLEYTVF